MKDNTEQSHQWNMADTITSLRMVSSVILLHFPVRSIGFLAIYSFMGMTDVLDGWIARKTGTASEFGARLDSIADLLFYSVLMLRIFPYLWQILPKTIWWLVMVIVLIRLTAYGVAAVKYHRFAALHTWLNKLTGADNRERILLSVGSLSKYADLQWNHGGEGIWITQQPK